MLGSSINASRLTMMVVYSGFRMSSLVVCCRQNGQRSLIGRLPKVRVSSSRSAYGIGSAI